MNSYSLQKTYGINLISFTKLECKKLGGKKKGFIRVVQAGKLISIDKYWHENACRGRTAAKKQNLDFINVKNYYFLNV